MNERLREILEAQTRSFETGNWRNIQDLLEQFSIEDVTTHELLDLVCNEVRWREAAGQSPSLEEYQRRFPEIHLELATQWQIDSLLDSAAINTGHPEQQPDVSGLQRYEILREAGKGAMGIVYEAYDRQLRRIVALKCLRREFGPGSVEFERFRREAESIGRLNHPNLVQIYDFGFHDDSPYIVMEFCSGGTLADRLLKPMTATEAADMMIAVSSAVGVAHEAGIIHRDLKPANILITETEDLRPVYKVSDFGLAKSLELTASATLTGSILGSPAYMPPEQAAGDNAALQPASDVYALGAILFQCLTSRPPFVADTIADVLYQVQYTDPLTVRQLKPGVPRLLEIIVAKCLHKNSSGRYANAAELRDDLVRYRAGLAVQARPERFDQKLWRVIRRHRMAAALISLSVLLLLGLVVSSFVNSVQLRSALTASEEAAKLAMLEKAEGLLGKAHGQRVSRQPGQRIVAQNILREAIQIGKDLRQPASWFADYRDELIETMWLPDLCMSQWKRFRDEVQNADFSPSGQRACIVYKNGGFEVIEWDNGSVIATGKLEDDDYNFVAFVDESKIVAFKSDAVKCYQLIGDKLQLSWNLNHAGGFVGGYWLNRIRQRVFVYITDKLLSIDLRTGAILSEVAHDSFKPTIEIAFHPHEEIYLISCYGSGAVEIRSLDSHQVLFRPEFPQERSGATGAAWNRDGTEFLLVDGDMGDVHFYQWKSSSQTASLVSRIDTAKTLQGSSGGIGGGVRVIWPEPDVLLKYNWNNQWMIHDSKLTRTDVRTPSLSLFTNFSNLPSQFDGATYRIALVGSPLQRSQDAGPLELALGSEQTLVIRRPISQNYQLATSHDGRFAVCFEEGRLIFINLMDGSLMGNVELGVLHWGQIAIDENNRLYLVTPDYAIVFQLELRENRLLLESANRVPLPMTSFCLNVSSDGMTWIAGAWAGYHSARYAGVWVKTPDEPAARKILAMQTSEKSSIEPSGKNAIVFSGFEAHRIEIPSLKTTLLASSTLEQSIQFCKSGKYAVAGGKPWSTDDWRPVRSAIDSSEGVGAHGFSRDGSQFISTRRDLISQLRNGLSGDVYLQTEGKIVYYDSQQGVMLCSEDDGLYFRDLKKASDQLSSFGLTWEGPRFEVRQPFNIQSVELSAELRKLKSYTEWIDYVDYKAISNANDDPDDGYRQFVAAMVSIDHCDYDKALERLERSSQLLPKALTPYQWQAFVFAAQQRWSEAISAASHFIEATDDVEMRLHRAVWYLEIQQPLLAIADADAVIQQNLYLPRRAKAIQFLAYEQLGDRANTERVLAELDRDRPTDRNYANAIASMVSAEISLRHSRLAAFYAQRILEPTNPEYTLPLAWCQLRNGAYEKALKAVSTQESSDLMQEDSPEYASVLALRVICNAKLGDLETARACMAKLQSLQPSSCVDQWYAEARETRLLIAEAAQVLRSIESSN